MAHAGTRSNKEFNGTQPLLCLKSEQLQNSLLTVASQSAAMRRIIFLQTKENGMVDNAKVEKESERDSSPF